MHIDNDYDNNVSEGMPPVPATILMSEEKKDSDCNSPIFTSTTIFMLWLGGIINM